MILIKVYYEGDQISGFLVDGHSPKTWGGKGENLLCAGVSTLLQSAHSYLKWQGVLEKEEKKDGYLEFRVRTKDSKTYQELLQMVEFGLKSLLANHQHSIKIDKEMIKR